MGLYVSLCQKLKSRQKSTVIGTYCSFILQHMQEKNNEIILDKSFSNVKVSKLLGIHPVTLSRMQTALQNENIIIYHGDFMKIKRKRR